MNIKHWGMLIVLAGTACGCASTNTASQNDVHHWLAKTPPGMTGADARKALADNGFDAWQSGSVIYGYRDQGWPVAAGKGMGMRVELNDQNRVVGAEAYASPVARCMLWPTGY